MYIADVKATLKLAKAQEDLDESGLHYLLGMRRNSSLFYYESRDACPSEETLQKAADFLTEITEVEIDSAKASAILTLYPHVRIKMAVYGGIGDTDVRDGLSFAAAHFFLGCDWPTFGDNVVVDEFVALLQKQAQLLGFNLRRG